MRRLLAIAMLALGAWASCAKSDSDSVVVVNVDIAAGTSGITQLRAAIALGTLSTSEDFPATNGGAPLAFPASFSLTVPRERQGTLAVTVTGVNAAGGTVAVGSDQKDLAVGGQTTLSVLLAPPVVDKKDAATGPEAGRDASADSEKRDAPGVGGSGGTGGATGAGGATAIDARPGSGGAGGGTSSDAPAGTGGTVVADAGRDATVDSAPAVDGGSGIDAGSTVRTLFDFATSTQGWAFDRYQAADGGVALPPINVAETPVVGLAPPSLAWDGTAGEPAGALKLKVEFNGYDQQVSPSVNFGSIVQDLSNKEVSLRMRLDPAKPTTFTSGGVQLIAFDDKWRASGRWFSLPADGDWHTYAIDLHDASGIDATRVAQLMVQLVSGGLPAAAPAPAFVPTALTAYLDNVQVADIPQTVTIRDGQALGAMSGYGWVALAALDTVTSPTCGGVALTAATPCLSGMQWSRPNALCVSGYIPALPAGATDTDFDTNWGIAVGVNAGPAGHAIGRPFATIAFDVSGTPTVGLRAKVHRKGDPAEIDYCLDVLPSVPVSLTSFNTRCWDGTGTFLAAADVPLIDVVGVQVPSRSTAITVTDLCFAGVTFGE